MLVIKTFARPQDRNELVHRLRALEPASVRRWGTMSAHQMVCHLCDACRMATGAKRVSHSPSLVTRTIVKWSALYLPLRWPGGIPTFPEIDQRRAGTSPVDFDTDVEDLVALMDAIAAEPRALDGQVHGLFGRMSRAGWMRWMYLHIDHHLRQFGA